MDLKIYYQNIRETAAEFTEPEVVVVSIESADGGKGGVRTEVPKHIAAKLIVEKKARRATAEEAAEFRARQREAKMKADKAAEASRVQFTVLAQSELERLRGKQTKE